MPQSNQMLFIKDHSGCFRLGSNVSSFVYDERRNKYRVIFKNSVTPYYYSTSNVDVAEFSRQLERPFRIIRRSDGLVFNKISKVGKYEGFYTSGYCIVFENQIQIDYSAEDIVVEEHITDKHSIDLWDYLKEIAQNNRILIEDEDRSISLADKYEKIDFVEKNSLLEAYLNKETYKSTAKRSAPLFPFGCNRSQYNAVCNALENRISVIEGPPGTGKTQTILNILANLLLNGKTMQIVSNNNSAVENVQEKLKAYGLDFVCAQLGRVSNKISFIENQSGKYPDMTTWRLDNTKMIRNQAVLLSKELQGLYEIQEKLSTCLDKLSEYKLQIERFPNQSEVKNIWTTKILEKYLLIAHREMDRKRHLSWWTRFRLRFNGLPATEKTIDQLEFLFFTAKIYELENECNKYREIIKDIDIKNNKLIDLSMLVLKDYLNRKYSSNNERKIFSSDDLTRNSLNFLHEYPVVLSTTFSATSNISSAYKFDYLIMDESSQVDIAAGALALSCANNAVIVGDQKQLPNVIDNTTKVVIDAIFDRYSFPQAYRYTSNSFLSSICQLYPNMPKTLLKEHYRCDPLIIGFCNKRFYNGMLIPMIKSHTEYPSIRVVRTVEGRHARGTVNMRQVEAIIQEILPELEKHYNDIGIITPYNNQVTEICKALKESGRDYMAATVHKFQGRENDAIVLSTVDNQIREFTDDPHLLNVAVSRAKKQFTLVVSAEEQPDTNIHDLIDYIEYYQGESVQSGISSIFDLLYQDYTEELRQFYETHRRVSQYDSENLTYDAILNVIKEKGYTNLGILIHYPLRLLITQTSKLTPDEREYASHSWTHLDFLIYDSITRKAKLAIEVDGTKFHKTDSDQGKRDKLKDSVLEKIGLPLLRLRTDGSQEKKKIAQKLSQTFSFN